MAKTKVMALGEEQEVCPGVFVTAYYAGHVVGAVMFYVRSGSESVLYTGDYNMTADQHLGAACMPHLKPDVLITEGTYAATVRDSRPFREHTFLAQVQAAIDRYVCGVL
jgi:integrator complex subunit 11